MYINKQFHMSYLEFDKKQLVNLEYALKREFLRTNRSGAYACTTIINCNTRKYHGLLVCPTSEYNDNRHVLLSMVDPTIVFNGHEFNLGIHKYSGGIYEPKGHKYIEELTTTSIPSIIYDVGGVKFSAQQVLDDEDSRVLIKYTVLETPKPIILRLKPFLAFRNIHELSKANLEAYTRPEIIENGIKIKMYPDLPALFMQTNKTPDFIHMPDWYYNIEYQEEQERGYPYKEDLFCPGYFELSLYKGESIVFSAGTEFLATLKIKRRFTSTVANRLSRTNYENCLYNAAQQFIGKSKKTTLLIAGYPWFESRSRDAMIATPGLTLSINNRQAMLDILDTAIRKLHKGLFPVYLNENNYGCTHHSADTPLWFIYAIQQLKEHTALDLLVKKYWSSIISILDNYYQGTESNIKMTDYCLIYQGEENCPKTWMDSMIRNKPVVRRKGFDVEVNALWYNAVCFGLEIAKEIDDKEFIKKWFPIQTVARESFITKFWLKDKNYLADFCSTQHQDPSVRPNQIIAVALPYSPLEESHKVAVINCIKHKLLTPKGLRTLSPADGRYKPYFIGNPQERERAYHNGTVHPWLLEFYAKAIVSVYKKDALPELNKIFFSFEEEMLKSGIGTINEVYDGDPPHEPRGAISQAWSVGALLQIKMLMDKLITDQP